jgi:hypothetical protein
LYLCRARYWMFINFIWWVNRLQKSFTCIFQVFPVSKDLHWKLLDIMIFLDALLGFPQSIQAKIWPGRLNSHQPIFLGWILPFSDKVIGKKLFF